MKRLKDSFEELVKNPFARFFAVATLIFAVLFIMFLNGLSTEITQEKESLYFTIDSLRVLTLDIK